MLGVNSVYVLVVANLLISECKGITTLPQVCGVVIIKAVFLTAFIKTEMIYSQSPHQRKPNRRLISHRIERIECYHCVLTSRPLVYYQVEQTGEHSCSTYG